MKIQLNYGLNSPNGQKIFKGEIVCVYPDFDIGIIKVIGIENNSYLELGDSDNISLRDLVYTVGYPRNPKYPTITTDTTSGDTRRLYTNRYSCKSW